MNQLGIYVLMYFIEAFIAFYYFTHIFKRKCSMSTLCLALCLAYTLQIWIYSVNNIFLNLCFFTVFNLLIVKFCFSASILSAVMHSVIMCACMGLSEIIAANLFGGLLAHYHDVADIPFVTGMLFILVGKLLYFVCLYTISSFCSVGSYSGKPTTKGSIVIFFTTILSFSIFMLLAYVSFHNTLTHLSQYAMIGISLLLVFFNCFIVWMNEYLQQQSEKILLLELERQKNTDAKNYNSLMLQQAEELRLLRHDMKNHLCIIQGMYASGSFEEANTYVNNLLKLNALTHYFQPTNCDTLNIILARYCTLCQNHGIIFQANAQNSDVRFLAFEDITALFCNLLDNAYEASGQCDEPFIDLDITGSKDHRKTIITLRNSCCKAPVQNAETGFFLSSKHEPSNHGVGLRSIHRVVKRYNGQMDAYFSAEEQEFHTVLFLYSKSEGTGL